MPALNHPLAQRLTLDSGLTLSLRHEPRLKRCAAFLRVHAGSHDVPAAWPGLAHFLEHLLFLGTERFAADDNVMAYVQRHGGQINARTSERHTDFFFELPPAAFEGGVERLCDMLAHPRMNLDDQLREREVLHAEFIAWAREPSAQRQLSLLQPLNPTHPLRAFHAGNRYSLPIPRPAFQQALRDFYQQFYHASNMSLSLVGPMPEDTLRALAERHTDQWTTNLTCAQARPPALMPSNEKAYQLLTGQCLNLVFPFEQLPEASDAALDFLCHWINADKPGGLIAQLREQQLCSRLKAEVLYQFNDQALLHFEFSAPHNIAHHAAQIFDTVYDWLAFFSAQQDWPAQRREYQLLQQRQQEVGSALQLARRDAEQRAPDLSEKAVDALKVLLQRMLPATQPPARHAWQLPAPNPFLATPKEPANAGLIRGQTSAHRGLRTFAQDRLRSRRDGSSAMSFSAELPTLDGEATVYLRWRLAATPASTLLPALEARLRPLQHDARQAGVELSFSAGGNDWLLKLHGFHMPLPAILEHALRALSAPTVDTLSPPPATPLMPIRQLLKRLPDASLQATDSVISDVAQCWASARWDGLAVGLPAATQPLISAALSKAPGTPDASLPTLEHPAQRRWITEACDSSEHALLVFCPAPIGDLEADAAWRLLAHLTHTPFYQQLRVEQQLGYAVFSGLRQLNGQVGLLLGVQSPHASCAEIFEHIRTFLADLPTQINALDETCFIQARAALAQQFSPETLSGSQASELLWHAKLGGHPSDYLKGLYGALMRLDQRTTLKAAQHIAQPNCAWLCVATQPETETFFLGES